ncbi:MAG TPA: 3-hydroxy-3-methylglutaryl CoA synthase [Sphingomicrobium sp.]|nr:3-hydroxy-3-methylglutaryl CoA synthase [Sphingomicrobium sp.]
MTDFGITAYGAYVPRLRLQRASIGAAHKWMAPSLLGLGKGERAFCSWDEDSITMAVEAARDALGSEPRDNIATLTLASTTLPYADLQNSVIAIGALALGDDVSGMDVGGSQRAGLSGLSRALDGKSEELFIASDRPRAKPASTLEMTYGAGAAAFRVGSGSVIARKLGGASVASQFVDHFRSSDHPHDYFWEERWIRDEGYAKMAPQAAKAALSKAGISVGDLNTLVMASPLKGSAELVARKIGFAGAIADSLDADVGYSGTAHPLLMLAGVLEKAKPGDKILILAIAQGAEALVLEVSDAIESFRPIRGLSGAIADKVSTADYLRMLSFYDELDAEWGMRSEKSGKAALTTLYREAHQLSAFVAGKCRSCSTVQFPQLAYCVNPECKQPSSQFDDQPLSDEPSEVLTFTGDWLSYYPAPPLYVGFVQFDIGARLLMEIVDVGPDGLDVGTKLRMTYRIKERDKVRGFNRYFWKATPVATGA